MAYRPFSRSERPEVGMPLLDDDLVRKQEGGRAILELHQQHTTPQIINRAQNARLFAKPRQTLAVPDGLKKLASPPNHYVKICRFHIIMSLHLPNAPAPTDTDESLLLIATIATII